MSLGERNAAQSASGWVKNVNSNALNFQFSGVSRPYCGFRGSKGSKGLDFHDVSTNHSCHPENNTRIARNRDSNGERLSHNCQQSLRDWIEKYDRKRLTRSEMSEYLIGMISNAQETSALDIHSRNHDLSNFPRWLFLRHWTDESRRTDPRFSLCISLSHPFGRILDFRASDRSKTRHKSTKTKALKRSSFDLRDSAVSPFHFRLGGDETPPKSAFLLT
jgi:hypothetical protein